MQMSNMRDEPSNIKLPWAEYPLQSINGQRRFFLGIGFGLCRRADLSSASCALCARGGARQVLQGFDAHKESQTGCDESF